MAAAVKGIEFSGLRKNVKVKPDLSRNVGGIDAQLPEEHRRLRERSDTLPSLSHVLPSLPAAVSRQDRAMRRGANKKQH